MKKLLSFVFAVLMFGSSFGSCSPSGDNKDPIITSETDSSGTSTQQPLPATVLDIITKGSTQFKIVIPEKSSDAVINAAQDVNSAVKTYTGASMAMTRDWLSGGAPDSGTYEVLIGMTNRTETKNATESIKYNDYVVGVFGNKVVITGINDDTTVKAVNYFLNNIIKKQGSSGSTDATVTMSSADNMLYSYKYKLAEFKCLGADMKDFSIVIPASASISERRSAILIADHIKNSYGANIQIVADSAAARTYEILIGKTNRTTVTVDPHEYVINASGTKLQILGESLYAYLEAISCFKSTIASVAKSSVVINNGDNYRVDVSTGFSGGTQNVLSKSGEIRVLFNNVYGNCDNSLYPVAQRSEMLAEMFLEYMPDVIGLQECSPYSRSTPNIITLLSSVYTEVAVTVTNSNKNNYTPLLYRADVLKVIDSGYHLYSDGQNDKSKSITWAVFEVKATGKRFAVCSTHFYWTGDAAGNSARILDAQQLVTVTKNIVSKHKVPVISGGDFNCNISSTPYTNLISAGYVNTQTLAKTTENIKTHHSYAEYDKTLGIYNTYTFPSGLYSSGIDHALLYGSGVTVKLFDIITDAYALFSSDHCPVMIDMDLK